MAKMKLEPTGIVIGIALGAVAYAAVVWGWPLLAPYLQPPAA